MPGQRDGPTDIPRPMSVLHEVQTSLGPRRRTGLKRWLQLPQPEPPQRPTTTVFEPIPSVQPTTVVNHQHLSWLQPDTAMTEPHGKQGGEHLQRTAPSARRPHHRIPRRIVEPPTIPYRCTIQNLPRQLRRDMQLYSPKGFHLFLTHGTEKYLSVGQHTCTVAPGLHVAPPSHPGNLRMIRMQRHCLASTQVRRGHGVLPHPSFLDNITDFGQNLADRPVSDRADDQTFVP